MGPQERHAPDVPEVHTYRVAGRISEATVVRVGKVDLFDLVQLTGGGFLNGLQRGDIGIGGG